MSPKRVFITGTSSGIGQALAEEYAIPGATLGLNARRTDRLQELQTRLEARGAKVHLYPGDVSDAAQMELAAKQFIQDAGGVDMVIANAGIGGPDRLDEGNAARMSRVFSVNVQGVLHTLVPFVPHMLEQRSGHLVAISSVAGFRALPGRAVYGATKTAVRTLMDGFRLELRGSGVQVTTVCPGFVASELTEKNKFHMPFFLATDKAARMITRQLRRGIKTYVFPWQWRMLLPLIVYLPDWVIPKKSYL